MATSRRDARPGQDGARPDFDNEGDNNQRNTHAADSQPGPGFPGHEGLRAFELHKNRGEVTP